MLLQPLFEILQFDKQVDGTIAELLHHKLSKHKDILRALLLSHLLPFCFLIYHLLLILIIGEGYLIKLWACLHSRTVIIKRVGLFKHVSCSKVILKLKSS